jgi:hypothetical protein
MPTTDDLREALVSLEAGAPSTQELLSALPGAAARHGRQRRSAVPAVVAAVLITVAAIAVAGLAALRTGSSSGAQHSDAPVPAGGHGPLLPFRVTGSLSQLSNVDAKPHSDTDPAHASGRAVVAEYGMEVTIDVRAAGGNPAAVTTGSAVTVHGHTGRVDARCPLRAATPSAAGAAWWAEPINPTCALSYVSGPWQVVIYVAGPGGGSRRVTAHQFVEIGDHLSLAGSRDPSTWFSSDVLLPK